MSRAAAAPIARPRALAEEKPSRWSGVVRAAATALAALSLTWGIALPGALIAAMAGAALGVPLGGRLGRSRLRLPFALAAIALAVAAAFGLAAFAVGTEIVPHHFGTGRTLRAAAALRFGAAALAASAGLRAIATRRPSAAAFELVAVAAAIPAVFASHRDGVIARPLWLSDYAWQHGIDPTHIFLGLGAAAVATLTVLLLVETRSGRAVSAMFAALVLILLAVVILPLLGLPTPTPPDDLGLTGQADAGDGGTDGGAKPKEGDGGSSAKPDERDGGSSAKPDLGDAGVPVKPEMSDGGDPLDGGMQAADGGGLDGGTAVVMMPGDGGTSDAGTDAGPTVAPSEHLDEESNGNGGGEESPMAVVVLDDDYEPPSQGFYFRQEVWSQWNGSRLVGAQRSDVDSDVQATFPLDAVALPAPPEAGRARVRALVTLLVEHKNPFALEAPVRLQPAKNPNPTRFLRAYRFESLAQTTPYKELFGKKAGDPGWSDALRAYYTEAPSDPRYAELAKSIEAKMPPARRGDPFATALAVKLHLDNAYAYSRGSKHANVADPTADFLFGDHVGYCVHFAHAAVLLWRSLGIPARVGTGYRTEDDDRHGSSTIIVRAVDAHAWPELYLEGLGWVVLDITPKTTLDPPPPPVDSDMQRLLGEMARQMPPDPKSTAAVEETARSFGRDFALFNLLLGIFLAALLYVVKIWRRFAPWIVGKRSLPIAGYRSALDVLSEVGEARRFGETREAFARRVGELAPSFEALTAMHVAAALGGGERGGESVAELAAWKNEGDRRAWRVGVLAVDREVRRRVRWWRRILGVVNPVSFLKSR